MSYLLVLTTSPSRKEALKLADILLTERLAACINISAPVVSVYRWKGKKQKGTEVQLWIKTLASRYKKLEKTIKKHHSYTLPEIIAVPIRKGSAEYLKWVAQETF